jgi:hypothetical protein
MEVLEGALRRDYSGAKIFFEPTSLPRRLLASRTGQRHRRGDRLRPPGWEKGLGPRQVFEYYEALDRRVKQQNFSVILVLLDGQPAPSLTFLLRLYWIISSDSALDRSVGQTMDAAVTGGALRAELWRHTAPYRGLAAASRFCETPTRISRD